MTEELKKFLATAELPEGFEALHDELVAHADRLEKRLHRFFAKCLMAFAVLGLTSAGSLLGFGVLLGKEKETSADIQQQRYTTIYSQCVQQNRQHDRSITQAQKVLPHESLIAVTLLVDELRPYTPNCKEFTLKRVGGTTP